MMTLIAAAALVAAQPADVPVNAEAQHGSMMQMGEGHEHARMAEMNQCCCKEMMRTMHHHPRAGHEGHEGQ